MISTALSRLRAAVAAAAAALRGQPPAAPLPALDLTAQVAAAERVRDSAQASLTAANATLATLRNAAAARTGR